MRAPRGLSLAELLVGLALFSGALLVVMAIFPTAFGAARQGRELQSAVRLAEREVERMRGLEFDALAGGMATTVVPWTHDGRAGSTVYTVQGAVSEPLLDLKRVEVTVSWTDQESHLVRLVTRVARE